MSNLITIFWLLDVMNFQFMEMFTTSNHDFFSQVGNGYLLSDVEVMKDEDYDY